MIERIPRAYLDHLGILLGYLGTRAGTRGGPYVGPKSPVIQNTPNAIPMSPPMSRRTVGTGLKGKGKLKDSWTQLSALKM